jgi:hypothetical protein
MVGAETVERREVGSWPRRRNRQAHGLPAAGFGSAGGLPGLHALLRGPGEALGEAAAAAGGEGEGASPARTKWYPLPSAAFPRNAPTEWRTR